MSERAGECQDHAQEGQPVGARNGRPVAKVDIGESPGQPAGPEPEGHDGEEGEETGQDRKGENGKAGIREKEKREILRRHFFFFGVFEDEIKVFQRAERGLKGGVSYGEMEVM